MQDREKGKNCHLSLLDYKSNSTDIYYFIYLGQITEGSFLLYVHNALLSTILRIFFICLSFLLFCFTFKSL